MIIKWKTLLAKKISWAKLYYYISSQLAWFNFGNVLYCGKGSGVEIEEYLWFKLVCDYSTYAFFYFNTLPALLCAEKLSQLVLFWGTFGPWIMLGKW